MLTQLLQTEIFFNVSPSRKKYKHVSFSPFSTDLWSHEQKSKIHDFTYSLSAEESGKQRRDSEVDRRSASSVHFTESTPGSGVLFHSDDGNVVIDE